MSAGTTATIALLGTSADPPTRGHQALLEQLLEHHGQVVTWASDNPGKCHALPLADRCQLLNTLVQAIANPRLQLAQDLSSPWAITTLERAQARWPGATLCFVVGSDLVPQILQWKQAEQILQRCVLTVVPRQSWPLDRKALQQLRQQGAQMKVLNLNIPDTASSEARRTADPRQVPAALRPLLAQRQFYGFNADSDPVCP